ncbi:hypothetical protein [Vreelandella neptunia]|jgi:hypothetical protein|uniref:Uncharacterized protein n=1 Tax=Vreelandella neptunia TaxID=115551 RepID=A0ABS9SAK7_9GAMM|nr:hypothetical protein [Halomonas neptunia]MCH4813130.1 hypothetical protein [Halomonas neptunia]
MIDRYKIQYELDKFVSFAGSQIGADIAYVDTLTDEKLAEGRIKVDFNKYGEIETPALDVINQASEVFTHGGSEGAMYRAERLLENIGDDLPSHVRFNAVENNITPKIERAFINEFEGELVDKFNSEGEEIGSVNTSFAIYELDIDVDGKQYQAVLNLTKDEDGKYSVSKDGDSYDIAGGFDGTNKEIKEAVENDIKALYGEKAYEEGYGLKATEAVLDILEQKIDNKLESNQRVKEPELAKKQKKDKGFGMSM